MEGISWKHCRTHEKDRVSDPGFKSKHNWCTQFETSDLKACKEADKASGCWCWWWFSILDYSLLILSAKSTIWNSIQSRGLFFLVGTLRYLWKFGFGQCVYNECNIKWPISSSSTSWYLTWLKPKQQHKRWAKPAIHATLAMLIINMEKGSGQMYLSYRIASASSAALKHVMLCNSWNSKVPTTSQQLRRPTCACLQWQARRRRKTKERGASPPAE